MFQRLGTQWALTLLAFLSLAFMPIPFLFYYYGERIRAKSTFAPGHKAATPSPTPAATPSATTTAAPSVHSVVHEMQDDLDVGEAVDQRDEVEQEKRDGVYQGKTQV